MSQDPGHVVVLGGGLAGLTAAIHAARGGARVTVLEARGAPGGRARSHVVGDAIFNEGPHALYRGGAADSALAELGIRPSGGRPATPVSVVREGTIELLPTTAADVVARTPHRGTMTRVGTALLGPRPVGRPGASARDWIEDAVTHHTARGVLSTLVSVATYCADQDRLSADAAAAQVRAAARRGVRYLDGGWQSIVDELAALARRGGVDVRTGVRVEAIGPATAGEHGTRMELHHAGETVLADAVVIATGGPELAARLVGGTSHDLNERAAEAEPVMATCLDLHLARLPEPTRRAVFGVDRPLYLSAHTPSARLCQRGEVLHVMRYGPHDDGARAEIEAYCDLVQPGWRAEVIAERFGRSLVVTHDRPRPGVGLGGRPGPTVADRPGLFVAGDWVGPTGLLADAAVASGRAAGRAAVASATTSTATVATAPVSGTS